VLIWAGNYIVARMVAGSLPPVTTNFLRWSIALCALLPFGWKYLKRDWPLIRANLPVMAAAAFFTVTCLNSFVFIAGKTTTSVNMTLIMAASPIFIIVLSRVINAEAITLMRILGMALAVFGVAWLITGGRLAMVKGLGSSLGDWWMLAAAFVFASYSVLVRKFPKGLSLFSSLLVLYIAGLVLLVPAWIWELSRDPVISFGRQELLLLLYLGLGPSLSGNAAWQAAVLRIGPARAGSIYYLIPLITAFMAVPLLDERITATHMVSAAFILGGVIIASRR